MGEECCHACLDDTHNEHGRYLNGHSRNYRQTIILSAFPDAGWIPLSDNLTSSSVGRVWIGINIVTR